MEVSRTEHEQQMNAMKQAHELRMKELRHDVELSVKDARERASRGNCRPHAQLVPDACTHLIVRHCDTSNYIHVL